MMRQALVVGINKYPSLKDKPGDSPRHLKKPADDAEAIAQILEQYGEFQVHRLPKKEGEKQIDPKATVKAQELEEAIQQLLYSPIETPETFLLFFAGHGYQQLKNGVEEGFLLTSDANPRENVWGVSFERLRQLLEESSVRQQIVWLDCCHSGGLFINFKETLKKYDKRRDRCFIAACREFQVAFGQESGKHGELTGALLKGLDPYNLNNGSDGWVTNRKLTDFISKELKNAPQHPVPHNSGWSIILTGKDKVYSKTCPYKALEYFDFNPEVPEETEDPLYFYGRTRVINQLLEKVCNTNFLAVLGASGSGKSSVVRAGLLYQLYLDKEIPGSDKWKIYKPFTPGDHPLGNLGKLLGKQIKTADDLVNFIERIPNERVILVMDQFEEVFTQCQDKKKQQQFIECLLGTMKRIQDKLCLVLVMRSDFQGKCDEYPELATSIDQHLVRVMQMNSDDLRKVIEQPAKKVGLEIVPELVNQMIEDVQGSHGNLPLLQYTLTQLWEKYRLKRLTLAEYNRPDFGGLKKALEKQANKVYDSLSPEEQQVAKWIFLKLTSIGEGTEDTRRQIRQQDLVNSKHSQSLVDKVVNRLAAADSRLVITSEDKLQGEHVAVVNIAHEALIRNWPKLQEWIADQRNAILIRTRLEAKAQEWVTLGKGSGGLLDEVELTEAQNWLNSLDAQDLGVALNLIELVEASKLAIQEVRLQQLTTLAEIQFASNKQLDALATAIKAGKLLKQTNSRLREDIKIRVLTNLNQLIYGFRERSSLEGHTQGVLGLNFSSDGQMIVSTSSDNTIKIWSREGRLIHIINWHKDVVFDAILNHKNNQLVSASKDKTIKIWKLESNNYFRLEKSIYDEDGVINIALSPNNKIIVSNTENGKIKLWDLSGNLIGSLDGHWENGSRDQTNDLNLSPDGQIIASAGSNRCVKLWSTENRNCIDTLEDNDQISAVSFVDNQTVVAATSTGWIILWNLNPTNKRFIGRHSDSISRLAVSKDSNIIASASYDGTVKIWDIQAPIHEKEPLKTLKGHDKRVNNVSFSSDSINGKILASSSEDGTIKIWTLMSPTVIDGHTFSFAPNGQTIATGDQYGYIKLWCDNGELQKSILGHKESVLKVKYSPNGKTLVSTSLDKTVKIWGIEAELYQSFEMNNKVTSISFSPDSKTLATASANEEVVNIWDVENGKLIQKLLTDAPVKDISFSLDGQTIAVVNTGDDKINFWKLEDEEIINTLTASSSVLSMSFSNNGHIAAACVRGIIDFWYFEGIQYNKQLSKKLKNNLYDITFSPESQAIIVAHEDETVILFLKLEDLTNFRSLVLEEIKCSKLHKIVQEVGFSHNGNILASANRKNVILWNFDLDKILDITDYG